MEKQSILEPYWKRWSTIEEIEDNCCDGRFVMEYVVTSRQCRWVNGRAKRFFSLGQYNFFTDRIINYCGPSRLNGLSQINNICKSNILTSPSQTFSFEWTGSAPNQTTP